VCLPHDLSQSLYIDAVDGQGLATMIDSDQFSTVAQGRVYLVGAGPGSPDLITVRALRCLQRADAVLYDALISPDLLREARPDAVMLHVGKRGYCVGSTSQETIHQALVRLARRGLSVCRLKGGDPCLFGRGGEEAEALVEAGISFEIIPGVTSALGAAASANIPLTHRSVGQSVAFATGHYDPASPECTLDWAALARMPTVVFYMGARNVAGIAAKLMDNGLSSATPVALLENGTLDGQRTIVGALATIGEQACSERVQAPALFVVGEVVRYRDKLLSLTADVASTSSPGAF
jgi:uroporphyrin-III C-methyltransferase